jgi:hypothetical protein
MSRLKLQMPSPALIIAVAAMFVALGSVSYAATQIKKNSVGTKQLKKNAVRSPQVKNKSLKAVDFKPGQLPAGAKGPTGPQGSQGDPGQNGAPGSPGAPGLSGYQRVEVILASDSTTSKNLTADCPPGKLVLGGGATIFGGGGNAYIVTSAPTGNSTYQAATRTVNGASVDHGLVVYAVCADVAP